MLVADECSGYKTLKMIYKTLLFLFASAIGMSAYGVRLQHTYLAGLSIDEFASHNAPKPSRDDNTASAKFTIMKSKGKSFGEDKESRRTGLVLDALSIGTQYNLGLLRAQQTTWASHKSIRHYFAATELDDADPTCHKTLNRTTIENIAHLCKKEQPYAKGGMKIQYEQFSKGGFMKKGAGWLCAQQRFAIAWETIGRLYRKELEVDDWALPDFLLLQDDDSYYNMVRIEDFLRDKDPSIPLAEAPCLIQHTITRNFSFPWGGFGFILSRGAIANLIRPIYCNNAVRDDFEQKVCARLEDDILGERRFFHDGMSVSDLMGAQVRNNLFTQFSRTNWSYCLHGDWAVGYYINFYYISSHVQYPGFENTPEVRIWSSLGGTFKPDRGNCQYGNIEKCSEEAHVCHRQNALSMANQTKEVAAQNPGAFRNYY